MMYLSHPVFYVYENKSIFAQEDYDGKRDRT